uniref:RING-type domain-containing protein n=1 Tax=viral metagenome TaxID=1070528 RepID=A0A6C0KBF7_9ZZZZ
MPTIKVVLGKNPAKFYYRGERISVDAAFKMYQKNARFVVDGKTLNLNRFGTNEVSECPVCLEDKVLVQPFDCPGTIRHGVCKDCASRIADTTLVCPMCRAHPKVVLTMEEIEDTVDQSRRLRSWMQNGARPGSLEVEVLETLLPQVARARAYAAVQLRELGPGQERHLWVQELETPLPLIQ